MKIGNLFSAQFAAGSYRRKKVKRVTGTSATYCIVRSYSFCSVLFFHDDLPSSIEAVEQEKQVESRRNSGL
jgi:hypothetical protein